MIALHPAAVVALWALLWLALLGGLAWVLCRRWDQQPLEGNASDPLDRDVPQWRLRWEHWRHRDAA